MPTIDTVKPVPTFLLAKVAEVSEKVTLSPASTPLPKSVTASVTVPSYTRFVPVPVTVMPSGETVTASVPPTRV